MQPGTKRVAPGGKGWPFGDAGGRAARVRHRWRRGAGRRWDGRGRLGELEGAAGGGTTTAQDWRERAADTHSPPPLGLASPDGAFGAVCVCRVYRLHNETIGVREEWVEQMGTREELRRRGLGRAALRAGMHGLRESGADTAVLETGSTNRRSQPLYEPEGFVTRTRIHSLRKTLA